MPLNLLGLTPDQRQRHEEAYREAMMYGKRQHINPYTALLAEVQYRAGHVAWLRDEIQANLGPERMFLFNKQGDPHDHPLLTRYDRERDRLDRVCKMAIDAGIAERYVQLAELQGQTLFRVMERVHAAIGLTDEQKRAFLPALREAVALEEAAAVPTDVLTLP